jgi:hypothetical protein
LKCFFRRNLSDQTIDRWMLCGVVNRFVSAASSFRTSWKGTNSRSLGATFHIRFSFSCVWCFLNIHIAYQMGPPRTLLLPPPCRVLKEAHRQSKKSWHSPRTLLLPPPWATTAKIRREIHIRSIEVYTVSVTSGTRQFEPTSRS